MITNNLCANLCILNHFLQKRISALQSKLNKIEADDDESEINEQAAEDDAEEEEGGAEVPTEVETATKSESDVVGEEKKQPNLFKDMVFFINREVCCFSAISITTNFCVIEPALFRARAVVKKTVGCIKNRLYCSLQFEVELGLRNWGVPYKC